MNIKFKIGDAVNIRGFDEKMIVSEILIKGFGEEYKILKKDGTGNWACGEVLEKYIYKKSDVGFAANSKPVIPPASGNPEDLPF